MHPALRDVVDRFNAEPSSFARLLEAADARSVPLGQVLDCIHPDDVYGGPPDVALDPGWPTVRLEQDDYVPEDWIEVVVGVTGSESRAQAALDEARGWAGRLSVQQWRERVGLHDELLQAIDCPETPERMRAAVERAEHLLLKSTVAWATREVARRWPVEDVARATYLPTELVRSELGARGSWVDHLDRAVDAVGPAAATQWACRMLGEPDDRLDPEPALRYLALAGTLRRRENRGIGDALRRVVASVAPHQWAPMAQSLGFDAGQAVLLLRDLGWSVPALASLMRETGWTDGELLTGLGANGYGPSSALRYLQAAGWDSPSSVTAMRQNGLMEFEIREHLRALSVGEREIADLLRTSLQRTQ
jgi:hypothetical protein